MAIEGGVSRRVLLKGAAGIGFATTLGAPAILRAQSDVIRVGHLTPRTGFLGPLGEYGLMGATLAFIVGLAVGGAVRVAGRSLGLDGEGGDSLRSYEYRLLLDSQQTADKVTLVARHGLAVRSSTPWKPPSPTGPRWSSSTPRTTPPVRSSPGRSSPPSDAWPSATMR